MTAAGTSIPMRLLREIASPISSVYRRAAVRRRASYRERPERQRRHRRPVVSIGNLTVGGTGKTPMTILLARELDPRVRRVRAVQGYGGSATTIR
ncbi:MAG: tetraacyldisaccharide 4'-kinase [Acidobacteriota bacterium]